MARAVSLPDQSRFALGNRGSSPTVREGVALRFASLAGTISVRDALPDGRATAPAHDTGLYLATDEPRLTAGKTASPHQRSAQLSRSRARDTSAPKAPRGKRVPCAAG